jgi:hypothetical protein
VQLVSSEVLNGGARSCGIVGNNKDSSRDTGAQADINDETDGGQSEMKTTMVMMASKAMTTPLTTNTTHQSNTKQSIAKLHKDNDNKDDRKKNTKNTTINNTSE